MHAAPLIALMLAASTDAPMSEGDSEFASRIIRGSVTLQDGDHEIWVLKMHQGDTIEMPEEGRLVPMESWILLGKERAETHALLEQLQGKPEWWMLGVGLFAASAVGVIATVLVLGR